jgi:hypothetical protein
MGYLSYSIIALGLTAGLVIGYVSRIIYRKVEVFAFSGFKQSLRANTAVILSNIFATLVSTVFIIIGFICALLIPNPNGSFFSNAFLVGAILGIWIYRYLISRKKS